MNKYKRLFLKIASSFALNIIIGFILFFMMMGQTGGIAFWQLITLYYIICNLFLNANYYRYIRHKVDSVIYKGE